MVSEYVPLTESGTSGHTPLTSLELCVHMSCADALSVYLYAALPGRLPSRPAVMLAAGWVGLFQGAAGRALGTPAAHASATARSPLQRKCRPACPWLRAAAVAARL